MDVFVTPLQRQIKCLARLLRPGGPASVGAPCQPDWEQAVRTLSSVGLVRADAKERPFLPVPDLVRPQYTSAGGEP